MRTVRELRKFEGLLRRTKREIKKDPTTPWLVAEVLARRGDERAVPLLLDLAWGSNYDLSKRADEALVGMDKHAVRPLVTLLYGRTTNGYASDVLARIGPAA